MTQKSKYLTKSVLFGGKTLTLYSLDGATWSSRKDELETIHLRHDAEQVTAAQLRGEADPAAPGATAKQPTSPALRRPTAFSGRFSKQKPHAGQAGGGAQQKGESVAAPAQGEKQKISAVKSAPKEEAKAKKKAEKKSAPKAAPKKKASSAKSGASAKKKKAA